MKKIIRALKSGGRPDVSEFCKYCRQTSPEIPYWLKNSLPQGVLSLLITRRMRALEARAIHYVLLMARRHQRRISPAQSPRGWNWNSAQRQESIRGYLKQDGVNLNKGYTSSLSETECQNHRQGWLDWHLALAKYLSISPPNSVGLGETMDLEMSREPWIMRAASD